MGFFMFNAVVSDFISSYLCGRAEGLIKETLDKKVHHRSKISSVALASLQQLQALYNKSEDAFDALLPDEVCLLTSILSSCSDGEVENLVKKVPYAKEYMKILRAFDRAHHTKPSIDTSIKQIEQLFASSPQSQAFAIAHLINTRAVALDTIPISYIDSVISYVRVAIILSNKLDSVLPDILNRGSNIEFLYVNKSDLDVLPSLSKCENISLNFMGKLTYIATQPECKKLSVSHAFCLNKVDELPKCQSFSLEDVTSKLHEIPSELPCKDFLIRGYFCSAPPELEKLPILANCFNPKIANCLLDKPLILYGLIDDPAEFKGKNGDIAKCIGYRQTCNGRIFIFEVNDAFNHYKIRQKHGKINYEQIKSYLQKSRIQHELDKYPAIEGSLEEIKASIEDPLKIEYANTYELLSELGYHFFDDDRTGEIYFSAPALDTLQNSWAQLRRTYTELPELKIYDSEGIANNTDFIRSFITHDVILSAGAQFIHDQIQHVIPILRSMVMRNYVSRKKLINDVFMWGASFIAEAKKSGKISSEEYDSLEHMLGYFVDSYSADIEEFYAKGIYPYISEEGYLYKECLTNLYVNLLAIALTDPFYREIKNIKLYEDMKICPQIWKKVAADTL